MLLYNCMYTATLCKCAALFHFCCTDGTNHLMIHSVYCKLLCYCTMYIFTVHCTLGSLESLCQYFFTFAAEMAPTMRPIQSINSRPACNVRVHKDICCKNHGSKVLAVLNKSLLNFCRNANTASNCQFLQCFNMSEQYSVDRKIE